MTSREDLGLRDLWIFLCGHAYSSQAACKEVTELTAQYREFMPQDVRMLLEGIEKRNAQRVSQWAASKGAVITKGVKLPQAAAEAIASNHRRKLFESCSGSLDFLRHLDPGNALAKLKEITAMLETAGITPEPAKEATSAVAKAKD
jgi:hypothetical protein